MTKIFLANDVECYAATCIMLGDADLRQYSPSLQMPVAVIVGEEDYATPVAMSRHLHKAIRGSTLTILSRRAPLDSGRVPGQIAAQLLALLGRKVLIRPQQRRSARVVHLKAVFRAHMRTAPAGEGGCQLSGCRILRGAFKGWRRFKSSVSRSNLDEAQNPPPVQLRRRVQDRVAERQRRGLMSEGPSHQLLALRIIGTSTWPPSLEFHPWSVTARSIEFHERPR